MKSKKTNWEVLIIGGSSGVGKSHLARQLSGYFKVPLMEVDDIRIALQQCVDRESFQDLFTFIDNPNFQNEFDEQTFIQKLLDVGQALWKPLDTLISKHVILGESIIIEGDSFVPELLAKRDLDKVKAIFIYDDLEAIKERHLKRNRLDSAAATLEKDALFSFAYGEEIRKQAEELGLITIKATPIETLYERTIEIINSSH
ncbi:MAG: hypothetical protein WCO09_04570 [bacterium]